MNRPPAKRPAAKSTRAPRKSAAKSAAAAASQPTSPAATTARPAVTSPVPVPVDSDLRVLQRVVFPDRFDLDIVPLYVETDLDRGANLRKRAADDDDEDEDVVVNAAAGETQTAIVFDRSNGSGDLAARRSATVQAGKRVSFGTYFNAFPASYWKRWTTVQSVVLRVQVQGEATVVVYRSNAKGHSHPVESVHVDADASAPIEFTLPLSSFVDGGWYWFDIAAGPADVRVVAAEWATRADSRAPGHISIGITTFNRPDMCVDGLAVLASAPDVLEIVDKVYVVDQGTQKVSDHPDFAAATAGLGDKLQIIEQANLGGSGGFSRAMDETATAGDSDYVLLLDDDVVTEPESILRAVTFADLTRRPTIVGGHMFSLYDRSVLHAFGEQVARYKFWWGSDPRTRSEHDFGRSGLRHTTWLHRRIDVDYNGWWACLIPTSIVRDLGLALPVFIKWDDSEYGLRAGAAGYPTVSMPGVAVWHVPWQDKNDALDWQAYYHLRNRLVAALLHSPYERGGSVISENVQFQLRHLLAMQYSTAELRLRAIEDVLSGPEHLHRDLASKMGELRALRGRFTDSRYEKDLDAFPRVRRRKPPKRGKEPTSPSNKLDLMVRAALGVLRQVRPADEHGRRHPELVVPAQDAQWWSLSNVDSALVSSADGTGAAWFQRDHEQFRALLARSSKVHAQLWREWPELAERYRAAAADFTSPQAWRSTIADAQPGS
ncbi:glycosyltransferase [Jatrophihabitans fulvus]